MKLIKLLVMISVIGGIILLTGCAGFVNKEKVVKDALENKYGEEMLIYSVDVQGSKFYAKCAPASNPEVVFETKIFSDGTEEWDDYFSRYTASLMNEILKKDLVQFFPDAYFRSYIPSLHLVDKSMDFRKHSLEEIVGNSEGEAICLYIYINRDIGSIKDYKEEYNYFTATIDNYVDEKRMLPIIVSFYYVSNNVEENVREYFLRDLDEDNYYQTQILNETNYKQGAFSVDMDDVGNPPNVSANFIESTGGWIGSEEEYIRRRKLLENN